MTMESADGECILEMESLTGVLNSVALTAASVCFSLQAVFSTVFYFVSVPLYEGFLMVG